jgi:large subunit ribosomal protein L4
MIKAKVYNSTGKEISEIKLPDFFNTKINEEILHLVTNTEQANRRIITAHTKTRANVSGGGKKPWRQKGTGRARAGSNRSPLWRGGGITFGPTNDRNFSKKINKKVKKLALAMALSVKVNDDKIFIIDKFDFDQKKTKLASSLLKNLPIKKGSVLIASDALNMENQIVFRNIPKVNFEPVNSISVVDIMQFENLLITPGSISEFSKIFKTEPVQKVKTPKMEEIKEKPEITITKKEDPTETKDE